MNTLAPSCGCWSSSVACIAWYMMGLQFSKDAICKQRAYPI